MRMQLLCVSKRPASWVVGANAEYLKRLQGKLDIEVRELPPARGVAGAEQQKRREGEIIQKAVPVGAALVALDERGDIWSSAELAKQLTNWQERYQDVMLVIGGAEGLAEEIRQRATSVWSLTRLTLPHQLARIVVIEQIYRAWSLLNNHPYHRA